MSNLVRLHQSSVFYQSLIQLVNSVLVPDLNALLTLGKQNDLNLRQLDEQIAYYTVRPLLKGTQFGLVIAGEEGEREGRCIEGTDL